VKDVTDLFKVYCGTFKSRYRVSKVSPRLKASALKLSSCKVKKERKKGKIADFGS
jgi:hypothetical protein